MKNSFRLNLSTRFSLNIAAGAVLLAVSGVAMAGCGYPLPAMAPVGLTAPFAPPATRLSPALYTPPGSIEAADFVQVNDSDRGVAGLVGMWSVTVKSDGNSYPGPIPYGVIIDFATIQYHSDGTEFQISGSRPPSTGDVCMGIWRQTGERTYQVKHLALAWVSPDSTPPSPTAKYLGPGKFTETIQLNRKGDQFTGTIGIDQYADDGVTLIEHVSGTMTGVRFSFD